jgi:hypothetical protein
MRKAAALKRYRMDEAQKRKEKSERERQRQLRWRLEHPEEAKAKDRAVYERRRATGYYEAAA